MDSQCEAMLLICENPTSWTSHLVVVVHRREGQTKSATISDINRNRKCLNIEGQDGRLVVASDSGNRREGTA